MRRAALAGSFAAIVGVGALVPRAAAQPKDDVQVDDDDTRAAKKRPGSDDGDEARPQKQDLNGHDLGTNKKASEFERDRFFVDKTDSATTEKGTLIQGSLTSTSFIYHETGGILTPPSTGVAVPSNSPFNRLYTDLRLQTDFRHIGAGKWDARVDLRGRVVDEAGPVTPGYVPVTETHSQSGFLGKNEAEIRELWIVRNGVRSDIFLGRQFIPDLGAVKIDGLRIDYASSPGFTWLGFGGLYPIRGSRSVETDYSRLLGDPAVDGSRKDAGRFTGAAGFGGAYRTLGSYGSIGGVVIAPLQGGEDPRIYGTSSGYWRFGPQLDLYHLAIVDVVGTSTVNTGLTNLSLGLNYKPDQRLRGTLSFNRVDTDTLNVQAQAFLQSPDPGANVVQNEAFIQRIATNEGRASLSAGLGQLQRIELTAAVAYRYRGDVTLTPPPAADGTPQTATVLPASQSVEVYGSITDRRSIGDFRLGLDGSRIFGVGSQTYQHTEATTVRVSAAREVGNGEFDLEVAYSTTKDDNAGKSCTGGDITVCFGAAESNVISAGGNLYYRFTRNWFAVASGFVNYTQIKHVDVTASTDDPPVTGVTGFFRIAYRF
jgi:hypothetical protein